MTAAFLLLLIAGPVLAHAELEESDPGDGETITTPYTLIATFSEEIGTDRSRIVVQDAAGNEVARGGIDPTDATLMSAELPPLEPGEYTAAWTAVTPEDNGVTRGQFTFTVAAPVATTPTSAPAASATPRASVAGPTLAPTSARPTPTPTPATDGPPAGSSNDILLALILAAIVLAALGGYLYMRSRR